MAMGGTDDDDGGGGDDDDATNYRSGLNQSSSVYID